MKHETQRTAAIERLSNGHLGALHLRHQRCHNTTPRRCHPPTDYSSASQAWRRCWRWAQVRNSRLSTAGGPLTASSRYGWRTRYALPPNPSASDHATLDLPMELTARAMTGLRQGRQRRPFRRLETGGHQPHQILRPDASLTTQLYRSHRGRLLRHEPRRPRSRTREHLDGGGSVGHKRDQLGRLLRGPARAWVHGPGE